MKLFKLNLKLILLPILIMFVFTNGYCQKTREDIPEKYKWNLADLFPSDEAWRNAFNDITTRLDQVEKFKGTLTQSSANLIQALEYNTSISKEASKLYSYVSMNSDLDTRNMKYTGMKQELQQLFSKFGAKSAFIEPEILTADWEKIDGFIKQEPKLQVYRKGLEDMSRTKKHTLSEPEERIMALSRTISGVPESVFGTFSNAEMPNPTVTLSNGEKVELTSSEYNKLK